MRLSAALLFLFFLSALAKAQDFQQWNEVDFTAEWRKVDLLVPALARTDTRLPNPQLAATGIMADYPVLSHLTVTGGYLFVELPQISDTVHVPLIAVSTPFRRGRFQLEDRDRFEKLIDYPGSPVRYRNRVSIDRPLGARGQWHLFASNEVFFNLSAGEWNQNRLQGGAGARFNRRLSLDVYYLQKAPKVGNMTDVVGTNLKIRLTPFKGGGSP
jgi:hypothetical protein